MASAATPGAWASFVRDVVSSAVERESSRVVVGSRTGKKKKTVRAVTAKDALATAQVFK